ncbi:lipopolysaccharide biosynthesis protein [Daejeonella sp.]|uniref:lipopolysaccharide biosynthesis protein n=1 Tax=Daejeonella sp. TaxID=2805397 RepID=UPI0030C29881
MQEKQSVLETTSPKDDEISLKELILKVQEWWKYLLSKWLIILVTGITGGIIGLGVAYFTKPVFIAVTTFVLEEDNGGGGMLGQLGGLASLAGLDGGGGGGLFQGDNIIELYRSRSMVEKTLLSYVDHQGKSKLLIDHYIEFNDLKEGWNDREDLKNITFSPNDHGNFTRIQDSILGITVKSINQSYLSVSKPDKKLSIIKVAVNSKDEFFAKAFNNQIVQNVNDFYVQTKTKKALENLAIIQRQTDSVRNVLSGAIYQTAAIADATPNLNPTRQILRAPAQRSQFNAEANKAILTQLVQNLELAKLSLRKETPLIQVIDQPVMPLDKDKFGKLKSMIIGGLLAGILIVGFLISRRFYNNLLIKE